jgi:uncharacterized protein (DUF1330 family)
MVIVAIVTVRRAELDSYRSFETLAAQVMVEHGGRIERNVVADDGASETLTEIHLLRFPDEAAFAAYRASPKLVASQALREISVLQTIVFVGDDGPLYG